MYARDFYIADAAFYDGHLAATTTKRELWWACWLSYVRTLGLDPHLQGVKYTLQVRTLTGFAGQVRTGYYGRGRQISAAAVTSALTAIGTTISLACGNNPTKLVGAQDHMVPRIAQMLAGFRNKDPPTVKKLPIEADIPEYIALCSLRPTTTEHNRATADLILIAFYYLLRVGEYTMKSSRTSTKRTAQFRLKDVTFFKRDTNNTIRQLPRNAPDCNILNADSATLKLDNQKNGWKGVCIHHEANGNDYLCPVKALGRRYTHLQTHSSPMTTPLSAIFRGQRAIAHHRQ